MRASAAQAKAAPTSKLQRLRSAWAGGDRMGALRIAARFPDLGAQRGDILTGWGAAQNPRFYMAMGRAPDELIAAALAALAERYQL